jgi:CHAT domain-containing protein
MLFPQENNPKPIRTERTSIQFSELFRTGEDLRLKGEYEEAIKQFERALFLAQKTANEEAKLDSLLKLGILYWNIGKLKESTDKYGQALLIAQRLQLKEKTNFCLTMLKIYDYYRKAKDYPSLGNYQKSTDSFKSAIDLAKKIDSKEHELKCLRQLSLNYWDLGNFQQFFLLNKEALLIARELNNKQEEGRCLNNIGVFYWKIDNYSEALKYYEESLEIATKLKAIEEKANCLNNIGAIYIDAGNYDRALEYLMQALNIDKQLKDYSNISKDLSNIGSAFRRKGMISENKDDFNSALNYYDESLDMAIKNKDEYIQIRALNNIGTILSYLNENTKALSNFQSAFNKAQGIQDIEGRSMILNNIGIVYSQLGNYGESTKYYQKAIDLALETKEGKFLWEPYLEIANSYRNLNNLSVALDNYKKSISVIEKIRSNINSEELKATYFGTDRRIEAYQGIIDLLIKLNQKDPDKGYGAQAFNYLERAKARSFLDSIEVSKIDITEGISQQLLNQETELMNEISKLYTKLLIPQLSPEQRNSINKELENCEQQLESLKREIRTASPAYANLRYPKSITLSEAQSELLDEETAFFAYTLAKENSYAFVITKNNLKVFPLPERKEIQRLVREYLTAITDVQNQDFHVGYRLYKDLIRPGLDDKKIKKIIFVPDDVLYFLPFETLLAKENGREWLIKDYDIAYVPSLSSLRELIDRKKAVSQRPRKDILAVGDPSFGTHEIEMPASGNDDVFQDYSSAADYKFSRLKYSGVEIEKIASLFKPAKRDILERRQASEENVKKENLSDYRIIHFATHALIDDKKPARSAIVLALDQNPKEDGFLQMREVFNLKLNADLVTLSACQTGLGQLIRGEGIEGLNRAFFYAGASSVMLSLWAINDQASYQLLERFYYHLRSAQPILGALRQAKLEMIESEVLSHPYYWGGFIVTGETDKVIFPRKMNKWILVTVSLCAGLALLILIINREMPSLFSPKN